jgi:plasmid stabilization system protein ParE
VKRKLHVEPDAEREVEEAADWYEDHEAGLGAAFVAAFRKVLPRIEAAPESFASVPSLDVEPPVRSARMKPYPYRVVFVLEGERLRVISVIHVRRDLAQLRGRVRPKDAPPAP